MASIVRIIRRLFGRLISCITGADVDQDLDEYMHQDAYNWKDDQNANVQLVAYRVLSDSKDDIQASRVDIKEEDESPKQAHLNNSSLEKNDDAESEIDNQESKLDDSQNHSDTSFSENKEEKSAQFEADSKCIVDGEESSSYELQQEHEEAKENQVSSESAETEETSIQMIESNLQTSSKSSQTVPSSYEHENDVYLAKPKAENIPFPMRINFPDVIIKVGKDHKFPTTRKVLCDNSEYFYERLASNKERLCTLKVELKYVNPEAFQTILHFLHFKQPFTCANLTTDVIRTATYLRMPQILVKIETIVHNTIGNVELALAKNALIGDMKSKLERSPTLENPVKKKKVLIKGQETNLKAKHMRKLSKLKYIRDKEISFFYQYVLTKNIDGHIFERLATRPHVVIDDGYNLTLHVFNVFKHNLKEAIFIDADIYMQSMETSLRLCTELLARS